MRGEIIILFNLLKGGLNTSDVVPETAVFKCKYWLVEEVASWIEKIGYKEYKLKQFPSSPPHNTHTVGEDSHCLLHMYYDAAWVPSERLIARTLALASTSRQNPIL